MWNFSQSRQLNGCRLMCGYCRAIAMRMASSGETM